MSPDKADRRLAPTPGWSARLKTGISTPPRRILIGALIGTVRVYRVLLSPVLPQSCRFHPTCSEYAIDAIRGHGPARGPWLALRRIARCHPWGGQGYDPVPPAHRQAGTPDTTRAAASAPADG